MDTRRILRESLPMSHPLIPSTLCVDRASPLPAHTALGTSHSRNAPAHAVDGFLHDVAREASALSMLREVSLQALNQVGDDRGAMPRSVRHMEPLPRRRAIQPEGWRATGENLSWISRGRLARGQGACRSSTGGRVAAGKGMMSPC